MQKEKIKLIILSIIFLLVIITLGLWGYQEWQNNTLEAPSIVIPFTALIIILLMVPIVLRSYKSIKENTPTEDERTQKATTKAAALTYFIMIYVLLAIGWFGDDYFERASQATGLSIGISAIIFISLLLYFQKRGRL